MVLRTAEEWIGELIDEGSLLHFYPSLTSGAIGFGDEVITALAEVNGRPIALWSCRPQINNGYISSKGAIKIKRLMDRALELGIPVISFLASPGISITEGLSSGEEYSKILLATADMSGQVPQIACVMGVNLGAPSYSAALMDLSLFNSTRSFLCVSPPSLVEKVIGEKTSFQSLGGADVHSKLTGLAHFVDKNMKEQIARCRWLLNFLPSNYREDAPIKAVEMPIALMPEIPFDSQVGFDVKTVIDALVDRSEWMPYLSQYGESMECGFSYIGGFPVGIVANQSLVMSGALDIDATQKVSRFVRLCDSYNLPVITLIDAPGFMPGTVQEHGGILKWGAQLIRSMKTKNPKLSVVLRKCYGAAAIVLAQTRSWQGDLVLALPNARSSVMGFQAAESVVYNSKSLIEPDQREMHYFEHYEKPEVAYKLGFIDEIVEPQNLRERIIQHLKTLRLKRPNLQSPVRGIEP